MICFNWKEAINFGPLIAKKKKQGNKKEKLAEALH